MYSVYRCIDVFDNTEIKYKIIITKNKMYSGIW